MASRLALVILLLGCIGLGVPFPAVATEVSAPQFNAGAANSFATNATTAGPSGFVREGAKVTNLKYVLGSYTATGSAECDGGVWKPVNVAGNCPPVSCSGTSGTAANLKITESKTCEGQYCFFETSDMPDRSNNLEIGKTTADHMFRIVPMGDGYIEFNKCTKTPYWFQRLNGGPQLDMAIPTACEDYSTFINNHPTNAITAEYACRPATFELCARSCSTQTNGSCGNAHGGSFTSTPKADLCNQGTPSTVTRSGSRYSWTCNGSNGGTNASCSATVPPAPAVNGYCGTADGDEFDSAPTSNLCSKGTASAVTTNASGYAWTCTGANGGVNASCTAKKPSGCDVNSSGSVGTSPIIFIQDLTSTYDDDLPNAKAGLTQLVNDPLLRNVRVGLTSFLDHCRNDNYIYKKETGLLDMNVAANRSTLINAVNAMQSGSGCDRPDSQWVAVKRVIEEYGPTYKSTGFTIVLATDSLPHSGTEYSDRTTFDSGTPYRYPLTRDIVDMIKDNNVKLLTLASPYWIPRVTMPFDTELPPYYYQQLIDSRGLKGDSFEMKLYSSGNFYAVAKEALTAESREAATAECGTADLMWGRYQDTDLSDSNLNSVNCVDTNGPLGHRAKIYNFACFDVKSQKKMPNSYCRNAGIPYPDVSYYRCMVMPGLSCTGDCGRGTPKCLKEMVQLPIFEKQSGTDTYVGPFSSKSSAEMNACPPNTYYSNAGD